MNNFDIKIFYDTIKNKEGKLCGIDFGTHKIGIALSDEKKMLASPLVIYIRKKDILSDIDYFINLILKEKIIGFVIGTCIKESGEIENPRLFQLTKIFFEKLLQDSKIADKKIPHYFHDESFSSHISNELLFEMKFNKNQIAKREDKIAATIILQEAIDEMKSLD